jgi:hypothetical protein
MQHMPTRTHLFCIVQGGTIFLWPPCNSKALNLPTEDDAMSDPSNGVQDHVLVDVTLECVNPATAPAEMVNRTEPSSSPTSPTLTEDIGGALTSAPTSISGGCPLSAAPPT